MKKYIFLFPVFFLLLSGFTEASGPEPGGFLTPGKLNMVWVILDQVSLSELEEAYTPHLDYLQKRGAFSLINVRTAGAVETESTYLSINAGNRCQGSKLTQTAEVYGRGARNGEIGVLIDLNQHTDYNAEPGLLGELARENNVRIAVLGNSDAKDRKNRSIVSMAMDRDGFVPLARIDESILQETADPWGYESNFQAYLEVFRELKEEANAIFIETGDISRIEDYFSSINKNDLKRVEYKQAALERIDVFLGLLLAGLDLDETQLAVISPTPPPAERGNRLGWILLAGREVEAGWLSSTSTRRAGIITIADLLSVFTGANGIEYGTDSRVYSLRAEKELDWPALLSLYRGTVFIYSFRSPYIKTFIFFQIVAIFLSLIYMLSGKSNYIASRKSRLAGIISGVLTYLLIAILFQPVNCLLLALLEIDSEYYLLFFLLILLLLEFLLLLRPTGNRFLHLYIITAILLLLITVDLFNNYRLLADSLLGYSSIIGARYYGLGNEYMGFYLGAFLVNISLLMEFWKVKRKLQPLYSLPFFFLIIYIIGGVNLGANFGGMLTAVLASAVTYYQFTESWKRLNCRVGHSRQKGLSIKKWPFIITGIFIIVLLLLLDYWGILGRRSHIGLAVEKLLTGDWQWLKGTILRKLRMNLSLLRWTIWTRVLLAMMVYLVFLQKKPVPPLKEFFIRYPYIKAAFQGALFGSLLTMLVNDSGVVAAATLLFYPVMSLLYCLRAEN
ncbi:MAG: hypothetical protein ACHQYO_00495 [Halanaerobiales bacterium]